MNIEETMIAVDGRTGPIAAMTRTVGNMGASARRGICMLDARLRTLSAEPEEGATTAERPFWSRCSNRTPSRRC